MRWRQNSPNNRYKIKACVGGFNFWKKYIRDFRFYESKNPKLPSSAYLVHRFDDLEIQFLMKRNWLFFYGRHAGLRIYLSGERTWWRFLNQKLELKYLKEFISRVHDNENKITMFFIYSGFPISCSVCYETSDPLKSPIISLVKSQINSVRAARIERNKDRLPPSLRSPTIIHTV